MAQSIRQLSLAFTFVGFACPSIAHEGEHPAPVADSAVAAVEAPADATTGSGALRFRYNRELSALPPEIAAGIERAHGGFAITPTGEIYFGLEGTGLVRISADLKTKELLRGDAALAESGLHNAVYVERDGGQLVLPDNQNGRLLVTDLGGELVATLGRPADAIDDYYADSANPYKPTDAVAAPDGLLYVVDGYSAGKYVLAADLEAGDYVRRVGGGAAVEGGSPPGKFSTCHGLTWDPTDRTLAIADRELHRVQKLSLVGEFRSEFGVEGANPCDIEFVDWDGAPLGVVGCLFDRDRTAGVVHLMRGTEIVSSLRPKRDLGLEAFDHIHNAIGVVVEGRLYLLCYGWNPGCFAVLEHIAD